MNDDTLHPWIEPEFEARIIALILGEASDFEKEEVLRQIEESPEATLFYKRMLNLHALLGTIPLRSEQEDEEWKLSEERRKKLIASIGESRAAAPASTKLLKKPQSPVARRRKRQIILQVAASIGLLGLITSAVVPTYNAMRSPSDEASMIEYYSYDTEESGEAMPQGGEWKEKSEGINLSVTDARMERSTGNTNSFSAERMDGGEGEVSDRSTAVQPTRPAVADAPSLPEPAAPEETSKSSSRIVMKPEAKESGSALDIPNEPTKERVDGYRVTSGKKENAGREAGIDRVKRRELEFNKRDLLPFPDKPAEAPATRAPVVATPDVPGTAFPVTPATPTSFESDVADPFDDVTGVPGGNIGGLGGGGLVNRANNAPSDSSKDSKSLNFLKNGQDESESRRKLAGTPGSGPAPDPFGAPSVSSATSHDRYDSMARNSGEEKAGVANSEYSREQDGKYSFSGLRNGVDDPKSEVRAVDPFADPGMAGGGGGGGAVIVAGNTNLPVDKEVLHKLSELSEKIADGAPPEEGPMKLAQDKLDSFKQKGRNGSIPGEESHLSDTSVISGREREELKRLGDLQKKMQTVDGIVAADNLELADEELEEEQVEITSKFVEEDERKTLEADRKPVSLEEKNAKEEPFSTFSLHVGDSSFHLARAALANSQWPERESIRVEEFVNALDYRDPIPTHQEKVGVAMDQARHPFVQQRNLLRISLATAARGRQQSVPLRLTLLLDNSGSMERPDRRETVQRALGLLIAQLQENDEVTLISFARQPRLLADRVKGAEAEALVNRVATLPSEGGTNLEAALDLAFQKAREQQTPNAQNRIILLTDGAANLGDAEPARLGAKIETFRDAGIAFDAAGIGAKGLNDEILEALTRKGDGRYYLLDRPEDADAGFARQIAGALRPAAGNVKVQVEFNPDRVGAYQLIGFEKHRLAKEDFRNDAVDAAELAAAEAGVAVYQVEAKPEGRGDIGSISVRFRDLSTGDMVEKRWPIVYDANTPLFEQAAPAIRIAGSAAFLGSRLREDALGQTVDLGTLSQVLNDLPSLWKRDQGLQQLREMLQQTRSLTSE